MRARQLAESLNDFDLTIVYALYIAVSIAITVWVARTLHKNGRAFLVDAMHGNEVLADSINHLLVVGFYLINVGFVSMFLRFGNDPTSVPDAALFLSTKLGIVLIVLGIMHFVNIGFISKWRSSSLMMRRESPVMPSERVEPAS